MIAQAASTPLAILFNGFFNLFQFPLNIFSGAGSFQHLTGSLAAAFHYVPSQGFRLKYHADPEQSGGDYRQRQVFSPPQISLKVAFEIYASS